MVLPFLRISKGSLGYITGWNNYGVTDITCDQIIEMDLKEYAL